MKKNVEAVKEEVISIEPIERKRKMKKNSNLVNDVMKNLRKAVNALLKLDNTDETNNFIIQAIENIEMTVQQKIAEQELLSKFMLLSDEQRESFAKRLGL